MSGTNLAEIRFSLDSRDTARSGLVSGRLFMTSCWCSEKTVSLKPTGIFDENI